MSYSDAILTTSYALQTCLRKGFFATFRIKLASILARLFFFSSSAKRRRLHKKYPGVYSLRFISTQIQSRTKHAECDGEIALF